MKVKRIILFISFALAIVILSSCRSDGQWQENNMPLVDAPEERAMHRQLLKANFFSTDFTAIVIVKRGRIIEPSLPFSDQDYASHIYEAEILEKIKGKSIERLTYSMMAEANAELYLPNYPIIVSLCEAEGDFFYMPDNGYESAASDSLVEYARKLPDIYESKQKTKSVCPRENLGTSHPVVRTPFPRQEGHEKF